METLFYVKKGKERPDHEYSPNVAGGGRTNLPSKDVIGGICRVPIMTIERNHPDSVTAAPQIDPKFSIPIQSKHYCAKGGGPTLENIKGEKQFVEERRLYFL